MCFFVFAALAFICGVIMLIIEAVKLDGKNSDYFETNTAAYAKFRKLLIAGFIILAVAGVIVCVCAFVIQPLCEKHGSEIAEGLAAGAAVSQGATDEARKCNGPAVIFAIVVFGGGAAIIYFVPKWTGIEDNQWEKEPPLSYSEKDTLLMVMYIFSGLTMAMPLIAILFHWCKNSCCFTAFFVCTIFPTWVFIIVAGAVALKITSLPNCGVFGAYGAFAIVGGLLLIVI